MQTDACTALDWVAGLFFQSGRLLGLIMQAIATVIGADLGGFADEFGACFEESLFTFFHWGLSPLYWQVFGWDL